jgi:hypothetical protein
MAAKTNSEATEALKQVTYLAAALKAPRITESATRLADHARDTGWTHEEYLAAVLSASDLVCRCGYDLTCRSRRGDHGMGSPPATRLMRSLRR